jgi:predicted nucleic acid-binding protein
VTAEFVADSSVGISWTVLSQATSRTADLLQQVRNGRPFVVPGLWCIEMSNALLRLKRRRRLPPDLYELARHMLSELAPEVDTEAPRLASGRIADLAGRYALSVYDCVYLELAVRRGIPLATRDRRLAKAAQAQGVALVFQR